VQPDPRTILYFADINSYSRGHARLRALADLGHAVLCIPSQEIGEANLDYIKKGLARRVIDRIAPIRMQRGLLSSLAAVLAEVQPDIFWADKPSMLSRRATQYLRRRSTRTRFVLFSEDDLWMPHNRSKALQEAIPEYDIVFTTKHRNLLNKELERLGARRVAFVTQAFDPYQHYPQKVDVNDRSAYGAPVGFVGNFEVQRATSISRLAEAGVDVRVWGNGWHQLRTKKARLEGAPVFNSSRGLFYSKTISVTDINLGFLRHRNRDTHTSRTFEIPACGGFMLAERSDEHESLFVPDVEAAFFSSDEELIEKAIFYLKNFHIRTKIARAGFERCLKHYTSVAQMSRAMESIYSR
jgi:spore maturation protein CgeB